MKKNTKLKYLPIAAFAAVAVALAGCGGGGGSSPVTSAPAESPTITVAELMPGTTLEPGTIITGTTEELLALAASVAGIEVPADGYAPGDMVTIPGIGVLTCSGPDNCTINTDDGITTVGTIVITEIMMDTEETLAAAETALEEAEAALVALMESDDPTRVAIAMAEDAVETAEMARDAAQTAHDNYVTALPENVTAAALGIAMAINSPTTAATGNGVPTMASATRTTDGVTEVTLVAKDTLDPAYASSMDAMTPDITGWSGDTQVREGEGTAPSEYVTVYTNIKSAKPMKLTYSEGDKDGAVDIPDPTTTGNIILLDDKTRLGYTGGEANDDTDDQTVMGSVNGIPGTFTCTTGSCSVTFVKNPGPGVADNTVAKIIGDGWTFGSTEYIESEATQDADYLYFGSWLQMADEDGDYAFGTFSGGDMPYTTKNMTDVKGEATYDGAAAGRYVMKELELVDGQVMPTSATHGQFTAAVALTAYFGGDDVSMTDQFSINGTVTNFMDGDTPLDFELKLDSTMFTKSSTFPLPGDALDGKASGRHGTVLSSSGEWSGAFFGNSDPTADKTDDVKARNQPSGVAGEFAVHFPDAHVAGGYGATQ